jgi:hypothetical protein
MQLLQAVSGPRIRVRFMRAKSGLTRGIGHPVPSHATPRGSRQRRPYIDINLPLELDGVRCRIDRTDREDAGVDDEDVEFSEVTYHISDEL